MTVICWDGSLLVSDGRMVTDLTLLSDNETKLVDITIKGIGKCVTGFAGRLQTINPFIQHLAKNGFAEMESTGEATAWGLAITRKGECYEFNSRGVWYKMENPTSIGSGDIVSQHYLTLGYDAVTAVIQTCKTELGCGGRLTAYDYRTGSFTDVTPLGASRSAVQADSEAEPSKTAKTS